MAEAAHHSGHFEDSADHYEEVLTLDPYHKLALTGYAMLMRMLGRLEDAEALYKQVLCLPVFAGTCNTGCTPWQAPL